MSHAKPPGRIHLFSHQLALFGERDGEIDTIYLVKCLFAFDFQNWFGRYFFADLIRFAWWSR